MECFSEGVEVVNLKTGVVLLQGSQALRDSMPSDWSKWQAQCSKRVYIEGGGDGGEEGGKKKADFCVDFYPGGHAPGINAMGKGGVKLPTVLVYRCSQGKVIDKVWIGPDKEGVGDKEGLKKEKVMESKVMKGVVETIVGKELEGHELVISYNDYANIEVWG